MDSIKTDLDALRTLLAQARPYVAAAVDHPAYGFFPGGNADPRRFTPDSENTEEEIAAHKAACEAWDRGERPEIKRSDRVEQVSIPAAPDGAGAMMEAIEGAAIVRGSAFGMGVYVWQDAEALALLEAIDAHGATVSTIREIEPPEM